MKRIRIQNARIVNEGKIIEADLLIADGRIAKIASEIGEGFDESIDAAGKYLLPGMIDDQVHFREPGLTHKADIRSESRAAVAGGITSFMEMPNTVPQALTQELLEDKYEIAKRTSWANYSFFMGASNHNLDEVLRTDVKNVCGVKVFMGSSTGDMLVDDAKVLENIFRNSPTLVATHCEKEEIVRKNLAEAKAKYGDDIPVTMHPVIRSREACYASSSEAVALAKANGTRLHILHISTADELALFSNQLPLKEKKITAEACIHHLYFDDSFYKTKGNFIKWNPAVKSAADRDAIFAALLDDRIDVLATDHAPHTLEEKSQNYSKAPSGGPLVQHAVPVMLRFWKEGKISLTELVRKMSHAPADCFQISERGYIREGYWADLILVDPESAWTVNKSNILYKCGWSPFEGETMPARITHTFVSGQLAYENGNFSESSNAQRLQFDR